MEEYSKSDSTFIAGCAIIMMFYYHFFAFPEFLPYPECYYTSIKYLDVPVQEILAHFGQLCVAIFAFNSGYVLYKNKEKFCSFALNIKRAVNFLISYWIVCLLFIVIAVVCNSKLPDFSIMIQNFLGLKVSARANYVNVAHAWYVTYYLFFLLICPIIFSSKVTKYALTDLFILIFGTAMLQFLPEYILKVVWPLPASITGYLVSKYKLFTVMHVEKWGGVQHGRKTFIICVIVLLAMIGIRHKLSIINRWGMIDGLFAFGTILSLKTLSTTMPQLIKRAIIWIGNHGMYYWFLHSAFVIWKGSLLKILYIPHFSIAITIWGIVLTTPLVLVCNWIANKIQFCMNKK